MFLEFNEPENEAFLADPVDGRLITSTNVPTFLLEHERYGSGLSYLQEKAGSIALTLYLVKHVTANDLGVDFEATVAEHTTIALEDNGWDDDIFTMLKQLASGQSFDDFLTTVQDKGSMYHYWHMLLADEQTFSNRLYKAIAGSELEVCMADIPNQRMGPYEFEVHRMWRQSQKSTFLPVLHEAATSIREWFMVANLGLHLSEYDRESPRILFPVGANHFLLQDKLMSLGIAPRVEMPSGDGGLKDPSDPLSKLFALRNVGRVSLGELNRYGLPRASIG